jgi:hypothetical protein
MKFTISLIKSKTNMNFYSYTSNQKFSTMKTIRILMLAAMLIPGVQAVLGQEENEPRYLLGNNDGDVHVSGFGSFIIGFSGVDGNFAVYNGGGGAVLLNQTVYFGGYGMGLSTRHTMGSIAMVKPGGEEKYYDDLYAQFGHGGFWLGYLHKSYKPIHFGFSTKLGWGSLSMSNDIFDKNYDEYDYYHIVVDRVFVATPQLEVEMNLLKWFKINASAGYQFVSGVDKTYMNTAGEQVKFFDGKDFNQPMFNLTFAFGGFGGKR